MQGIKSSFTSSQVKRAKTLYSQRRSSQWVASQLGLSNHSSTLLLKQAGVYQTGPCIGNLKYPIQEDYFDAIDSHEKAYFLGFMYADGHNTTAEESKTNKSYTCLHLHAKDRYILEHFRDLLYISSNKIPLKETRRVKDGPVTSYSLVFRCKRISDALSRLGISKGKTHESYLPDIDNQFMCSFMLGYFDGDGSIYLQRKKTGRPSKVTNMAAFVDIISNHFIISEMVQYFNRIGIRFKTKRHRNPHYLHMYVCSEEDVRAFDEHVYSHQKVYLKRKRDLFLEFYHYKKTRAYGKEVKEFNQ